MREVDFKFGTRRDYVLAGLGAGATGVFGVAAGRLFSAANGYGESKLPIPENDYYYALQDLLSGRRELQFAPQQLVQAKTVRDETGNVSQFLALHDNGFVYRSFFNPQTKRYAPFQPTSVDQPLHKPSAFATTEDGNAMLMVGEKPRDTLRRIFSYDGGKTWRDLNLGRRLISITDVVHIPGTTSFILNVGSKQTTDPDYYVANLNPKEETEEARPVNYSRNTYQRKEVLISRVDRVNTQVEIISVKGESGIAVDTVNYQTGKVMRREKLDGKLALGTGLATYEDSFSNRHILTSSLSSRVLHDVNRDTGEVRLLPYSDWLIFEGSRRSFGYNLDLWSFFTFHDSLGRVTIFFAGGCKALANRAYVPVVGTYLIESETSDAKPHLFYRPVPYTVASADGVPINIQPVRINGQNGVDMIIPGLGKAFLPADVLGNFSAYSPLLFPNKGLGK